MADWSTLVDHARNPPYPHNDNLQVLSKTNWLTRLTMINTLRDREGGRYSNKRGYSAYEGL